MSKEFKSTGLVIFSLIMIASLLVACTTNTVSAATTGTVSSITESNSVESSGNITAKQETTLSWQTTGIVGKVNVSSNGTVKKGDVLEALDPATAPSDVILAQQTLISAKDALANAQDSTTASADAQQALVQAQSAYDNALGNYWDRNQTECTTDQITVYQQKIIIQTNTITDLQQKYNDMGELPDTDSRKALALQNLTQAQIDLTTLQRELGYCEGTPTALDVQSLLAALNVAKANLETAQRAYAAVQNGTSSDTIISAQAQVDAAQSTVNELYITAPFDGEIAAIQTQVGDQVEVGTPAIILVDRSLLYVDVLVGETDISKVKVGDTAAITYAALPNLTSTGKVTFINPVGITSGGVVNYDVRVTLDNADPSILLGATATVVIQTGAASTALTVPVAAVQSDSQGEYVMKVNSDGSTTRVTVVSGTVSGTSVIVSTTGLKDGDTVELFNTTTSSSSSSSSSSNTRSFGGGSFFGGAGSPPGN